MDDANEQDIEQLFSELLEFSSTIDVEEEIARIAEQSLIELKNDAMMPIFDEYYGAKVVNNPGRIKAARKRLKDPKGGLTAAGRAYFKRKEGANLKPGVKGPANTPEKMRRKGSFLTRFFTNPSGPMVDEKGRATRLALSAAAWGEPVPKNREDAAKLAAKGRRLLERYQNTKKKSQNPDEISRAIFSPQIKSEIHPDIIGIGEISVIDEFESTPSLRAAVSDRQMLRKEVAKLSPSIIDGEKAFVDNEMAMERMNVAARHMAKRRKSKKRR